LEYLHETFGERNGIERWFRELKERARRFHSNVNAETIKSVEEMASAVALAHNILAQSKSQGGAIPT